MCGSFACICWRETSELLLCLSPAAAPRERVVLLSPPAVSGPHESLLRCKKHFLFSSSLVFCQVNDTQRLLEGV